MRENELPQSGLLTVCQISLTILVAATGIILAVAEGGPIPALTAPFALVTLYFVDWKKVLKVPEHIITWLGGLAFLLAGIELFSGSLEAPVLSGAHLLVYLTWVFLIQQKGRRQNWLLCALTILQIAVAAVLTNQIWFGGALAAYVFLSSWTMSLFLVQASHERVDREGPPEVRMIRRRTSLDTEFAETWNGLSRGQEPVYARFVGGTLVLTCLSLVFSLAFFLLTPRVWMNPRPLLKDSPLAGQPLTGFTDKVRLGDLGEILESSEPVMEVRLLNVHDNTALRRNDADRFYGGEPLFRGAVLGTYDSGRWEKTSIQNDNLRNAASSSSQSVIQQRIILQPLGTPTLFSAGHALSIADETDRTAIFRWNLTGELSRSNLSNLSQPFEYSVFTTQNATDTPIWSLDAPNAPRNSRESRQRYLDEMLAVPSNLGKIQQLTKEVIGESTAPEEIARKINHWLQSSGTFSYTLKLNVTDTSIDPLEDFLVNRKQGHCEYFASAMAIMLRQAGIPSRLVSGFKGGVYSARTKSLHVQQLHAHSWVEAYIDKRWQTYDPTPAVRAESVSAMESEPRPLAMLWKNVKDNWTTAVRMSQEEQRRLVYEPIRQSAIGTVRSVQAAVETRQEQFKSFVERLRSTKRWDSREGLILIGFFASVILLGIWLGRKLYRWSLKLSGWDQKRLHAKSTRRVPFYERLCEILKREGITRQNSQTAREFVRDSLHQLEPKLTASGMNAWPEEVVEQFYRVRFGNDTLNDQESQMIDTRLKELEVCLKNGAEKSP